MRRITFANLAPLGRPRSKAVGRARHPAKTLRAASATRPRSGAGDAAAYRAGPWQAGRAAVSGVWLSGITVACRGLRKLDGCPMRYSRILLGSTLVVLLTLAPFARGQGVGGSSTEASLGIIGLRVDRSAFTAAPAELPSTPQPPTPVVPTEISLVGSSVVVELGRMAPDGRFIRPRLLVGLQSTGLKYWMREIGIPAERCMLPLVRGRLRRNAENGDVGAALHLSARCTFY